MQKRAMYMYFVVNTDVHVKWHGPKYFSKCKYCMYCNSVKYQNIYTQHVHVHVYVHNMSTQKCMAENVKYCDSGIMSNN